MYGLGLLFLLAAMVFLPGVVMLAGIGLLVFIPAYLMVNSLLTVVLAPQQVMSIARSPRVRRVHSLEHATVNVLEEWLGPLPGVGGLATCDGFYLWGAEGIDLGTLMRAAQTGLWRMKRGETGLALHPRCGTSLIVGRFLFAVVFLMVLFTLGYFTFSGVLLAILVSWILGRPLGMLVERYLTTSPMVQGMELASTYWNDRPVVGMGSYSLGRGAYFFEIREK